MCSLPVMLCACQLTGNTVNPIKLAVLLFWLFGYVGYWSFLAKIRAANC